MELDQTLRRGNFELAELAAYLDGLDAAARLAAVRGLGGKAQAALFEAAAGGAVRGLDDLVPPHVAPLSGVVHFGINSLPMFRTFAKVFYRVSPAATELFGYNQSGGFVETLVGPGYFVVHRPQGSELLVDYTRLPEQAPPSFPAVIPNEARLGRFVYAGMRDILRRVSTHVTIGRAMRDGKVVDNWFALTRSDASPAPC